MDDGQGCLGILVLTAVMLVIAAVGLAIYIIGGLGFGLWG